MGGVHLRGFSLFRLHMRELLDNLSIDARVFRVGTFKSAVEPFLRNDMSPEAKEANLLWLNNLWQSYLADITTNRKLDPAVVQELLDHFPARLAEVQGDRAGLALAAGLVDALKTRAEVNELLTQKLGPADNGKGYKQIGFQHYLKTVSRSYTDTADKKQLIGIISATGNILPGDGAIGNIGADDLCKRIRKAGQDARIKALVLRVNTGGGSTLASEQIRQELEQLQKAGKTVVVSMGSMAASGGYWLAANADAIVAAPTTLTGSIGIFGIAPDLQRTLARLGVHGDGVGTTAIARFGNPAAGMSEAEAAMMQLDVERGYRHFIEIVATGRKMSPEQVDRIAQGRIWDGTTAHSLGLVDRLGNLETAVAEAARLAKVPKENAVFLQDDIREYLGLDQIRQSMQTLLARFTPSLLPRDPVQQLLGEQLDMLPPDAPAGLYSHCLVPLSALSVR
jgi:protease-4